MFRLRTQIRFVLLFFFCLGARLKSLSPNGFFDFYHSLNPPPHLFHHHVVLFTSNHPFFFPVSASDTRLPPLRPSNRRRTRYEFSGPADRVRGHPRVHVDSINWHSRMLWTLQLFINSGSTARTPTKAYSQRPHRSPPPSPASRTLIPSLFLLTLPASKHATDKLNPPAPIRLKSLLAFFAVHFNGFLRTTNPPLPPLHRLKFLGPDNAVERNGNPFRSATPRRPKSFIFSGSGGRNRRYL